MTLWVLVGAVLVGRVVVVWWAWRARRPPPSLGRMSLAWRTEQLQTPYRERQ